MKFTAPAVARFLVRLHVKSKSGLKNIAGLNTEALIRMVSNG